MPTALPNRLAYLASTSEQLQQLDPGSLGDDNPEAMEIVESAIRARVRGMSKGEAKRAIVEDCAALRQWMEQPGFADPSYHFIFGAMFGLTMWADFGELAS